MVRRLIRESIFGQQINMWNIVSLLPQFPLMNGLFVFIEVGDVVVSDLFKSVLTVADEV